MSITKDEVIAPQNFNYEVYMRELREKLDDAPHKTYSLLIDSPYEEDNEAPGELHTRATATCFLDFKDFIPSEVYDFMRDAFDRFKVRRVEILCGNIKYRCYRQPVQANAIQNDDNNPMLQDDEKVRPVPEFNATQAI